MLGCGLARGSGGGQRLNWTEDVERTGKGIISRRQKRFTFPPQKRSTSWTLDGGTVHVLRPTTRESPSPTRTSTHRATSTVVEQGCPEPGWLLPESVVIDDWVGNRTKSDVAPLRGRRNQLPPNASSYLGDVSIRRRRTFTGPVPRDGPFTDRLMTCVLGHAVGQQLCAIQGFRRGRKDLHRCEIDSHSYPRANGSALLQSATTRSTTCWMASSNASPRWATSEF